MTPDQDLSARLLPCPFCGGEAEFSKGKTGDGKDWHYIECASCEAMGPSIEYAEHNIAVKEALAEVWNIRPDHERAVQAAVAKAVEAERAEMQALVDAAHGLSFGEDWNKGNAALHYGYRQKLLAAIGAIKGKMASPQAIAAAIRARKGDAL